MKKVDFTIKDLKDAVGSKYAAVIIISNRAKAIRENPADVDEKFRKLKPTVTATREFFEGKLKYPKFDIKVINVGE